MAIQFCVRILVAALLFGVLSRAGVARAEDGGNDACPAVLVEADDVRERYDAEGRLVHQLRLQRGRHVQDVAVAHQDGHAVARTEATAGQLRIARTQWDADRVTAAECVVNGVLVARAAYRYDGDRLIRMEKQFFGDAAASAAGETAAAAKPRTETTHFFYDADGNRIATEVRGPDGKRISISHANRAAPAVPVQLAFSAGGSYQSDTELYDVTAGIGIHRRPKTHRYGSDPLEVSLEGTFRFHRVAGATTTDQTTVRFGADYHYILPRITLFTFTSTDRNLPANLQLNLEEAVLGVKVDIIPLEQYSLDASFAPVWNYRSIVSPAAEEPGTETVENTSKLRGSFRARAGFQRPTWSLVDTFEFLPTLFGDDVAEEDDFWSRTVIRNTVRLEINLTQHLVLREEFKYTRDPAMRAQADCTDSNNSLCRGYALATTTSLILNLDL
jgi:hypothetical protein